MVAAAFLIWLGGSIATTRADIAQRIAINNAVMAALADHQAHLTCEDIGIVDTVRRLARDGIHTRSFSFYIEGDNRRVQRETR